ncbi:hypothetical protein FNH22_24310 [Fulvivirga sp. M361]|uniref:succinylglutamate desuccinylase/aspartoacylase family protein n=1 Tax=Fulvivirga sp. M361 TaxID=2594266 RepID=UPI00117AAA11|nr:succinylglutamate desuccinylase/aspartoacylase family protein [Fulvivirga sp. M361]TRX51417.1 hypothetical protein FNH22_24310 [Fulvivirga sp. M361]
MDRIIEDIEGSEDGPLVVLVSGVHGNEKSGVEAAKDVVNTIALDSIPFRGRIIAIRGNLQALAKNKRFIRYDLNRCWHENAIVDILSNKGHLEAEDLEVRELLDFFNTLPTDNHSPKLLVDLHSTSSEKGDFIVIPEDESQNPIVQTLKLPVIIDLNKHLEGTLLQYMHHHGFISFAFEGGAVGTDEAHSLHISGIWELLHASGMISSAIREQYSQYSQYIKDHHLKLPRRVSVVYHHKLETASSFRMRPGYHNFMHVKKGELLAHDTSGEIRSAHDGMIFMPLYQPEGDDGFFIVKEV